MIYQFADLNDLNLIQIHDVPPWEESTNELFRTELCSVQRGSGSFQQKFWVSTFNCKVVESLIALQAPSWIKDDRSMMRMMRIVMHIVYDWLIDTCFLMFFFAFWEKCFWRLDTGRVGLQGPWSASSTRSSTRHSSFDDAVTPRSWGICTQPQRHDTMEVEQQKGPKNGETMADCHSNSTSKYSSG